MDLVISILFIATVFVVKLTVVKDVDKDKVVVTKTVTSSSGITRQESTTVKVADIPVGNNLQLIVDSTAFEVIPRQLGLIV